MRRVGDSLRPTAVVWAAVEALAMQFFEPLSVRDLLVDAWVGATAALMRSGAGLLPPPKYPVEPVAAHALHERTFPTLEDQAESQVSFEDLTTAALEELLARRRDGHTLLFPRGRFWSFEPDSTSPAGSANRTFGMVLTDTSPLTVIDLVPRGPAQRAGLRRGHIVLAINGQSSAHLRRAQAAARFDWQPGALNRVTVRAPGGELIEFQLSADLLPMPVTRLLPGPFGLLRVDGFAFSGAEAEALRAALIEFEQSEALGADSHRERAHSAHGGYWTGIAAMVSTNLIVWLLRIALNDTWSAVLCGVNRNKHFVRL